MRTDTQEEQILDAVALDDEAYAFAYQEFQLGKGVLEVGLSTLRRLALKVKSLEADIEEIYANQPSVD